MRSIKRKGDAAQLFIILIMLFVFAVALLIFAYLFITTSDALKSTVLNDTEGGHNGLEIMKFYGGTSLQYVFVFIYGVLAIGTIVTSFSIKVHPVFFPINIFLLIITIIVAVGLSNAYQLLNDGVLASVYAQQTMTNFIMENLVRFTVVLGILDMIVLFIKFPGGAEGI